MKIKEIKMDINKLFDRYKGVYLTEIDGNSLDLEAFTQAIAEIISSPVEPVVMPKIVEALAKLQRYEATQNEGGGVDYWVSLEKDSNGEVVLWNDIKKITHKME